MNRKSDIPLDVPGAPVHSGAHSLNFGLQSVQPHLHTWKFVCNNPTDRNRHHRLSCTEFLNVTH